MPFQFDPKKKRPVFKALYIQISPEMHEEIIKVAKENDSSMVDLVTQMILHCLDEMKKR